MAITAVTRTPTTWQTLTTSLAEKWVDKNDSQDIATKATPFLFWLFHNSNMVKREALPHQMLVRLEDDFTIPGDAYEYDDAVAMGTFRGSRAGYEYIRQYSWPLQITHQEELEHTAPEALVDYVDMKMHKLVIGASLRLATDLFAGSYVNTKRITGLEQICYAARPESTIYSGSTIVTDFNPWKLRQATNTYLNIARDAFTADETGGTGWENVSIDYRNDATNTIQVSPYAPHGPDAGLIGLNMAHSAARYGTEAPNFMVSTRAPWERYQMALQAKTIVYQTKDPHSGADLFYPSLMFKGSPWLSDEFAKTWNVANASNTITSLNNVYFINTNYLKMFVDSRMDFEVTEPRTPLEQHMAVRHLRFRGQLLSNNPRYLARAYNIPE